MTSKFTLHPALKVLLFALLFTGKMFGQCIYNGPEPDSGLTPDCTTQTTAGLGNGVGAGAQRFYTGFSAGTWYYFNLDNTPGNITCASANFADAGKTTVGLWNNIFNTTAYMLAPATTSYVWIQTASSGGWSGTSALLTYGVAVPSTPVWSANPSTVCSSAGTVYSVAPVDYATEYNWSVSGGIGYINGNVNQTSLTTSSNSITVTFTGASSSDSVTVFASNNGVCSSAAVSTYINSFISPTISLDANPGLCAGGSSSLSVAYTGGGSPQFQWQYNDAGNWVNIADGTPAGVTYTLGTGDSLTVANGSSTPASVYQYQCIVAQSGCASNPVSITVFPNYNDTIVQAICEGQSFEGYSATGTFTDAFLSVNGCDSVRTLELTVLPSARDTVYQTICEGQSFEGYSATGTFVDTYTGGASNGCDSIRTLELTVLPSVRDTVYQTICEGQSFEGYSTSGSFDDTFTGAAANGCDSIRTLELTVLPSARDTVYQTICEGQSFEGYSATGTFVDTYANGAANGCDSIRTLELTVLPTARDTVYQTICEGQSFEGYSGTGTFVDTYANGAANGCDSIRTLNLTVLQRAQATVAQTICQGQSFEGYSSSGTFIDTLVGAAANGCDSIRTLNLTVLQPAQGTVTQTICQGQSFEGYSSSGTFTDTYTGAAANGCDSIRTLNLTVLVNDSTFFSHTICQGDTFLGLTTQGSYFTTLPSTVTGCDSVLVLQLTVLPLPAQPVITQHGDTLISTSASHYQWYQGGTLLAGDTNQILIITASGTYSVVVSDGSGCDNQSAPFIATGVGIRNLSNASSIRIFPNPTNDVVNVEIGQLKTTERITVRLLNEVGQLITEITETPAGSSYSVKLSLREYSAGVYYLQIQQGNWITGQRIITMQ